MSSGIHRRRRIREIAGEMTCRTNRCAQGGRGGKGKGRDTPKCNNESVVMVNEIYTAARVPSNSGAMHPDSCDAAHALARAKEE